MVVKVARFVALLLTSLTMALAFCHLMQLPPRMSYDAAMWVRTQSLFEFFGPPVGARLELGAMVSAVLLTFLVRRQRPALWWTLAATACLPRK